MMTPLEKLYDGLMRLPIVFFEMYFLVREAQGIRQLVAAHPYIGDDWSFVATLLTSTHGLGGADPCRGVRGLCAIPAAQLASRAGCVLKAARA